MTTDIHPEELARHARQDARKRQLLNAAATLVVRRGSHAVSMQMVAEQAGVSVGLIYRYFRNKQELIQGVILGLLEDMQQILEHSDASETDPVAWLTRVFRSFCQVVDDNREAVVMTYRESASLDARGRQLIKELEVATAEPLAAALRRAVADGALQADLNIELVAYDLLVTAHSWALKHWYFAPKVSFEEFVDHHVAALLAGTVTRGDEPHDQQNTPNF